MSSPPEEPTREELLLTLCILHGGHLWDASGPEHDYWHDAPCFMFDAGWTESTPNPANHYVRGRTWTAACEKYLTRHGVPFDHITSENKD